MKKILAKILAVALILFFVAIYLYTCWMRPFNENPDEPAWFILVEILAFHAIVFGGVWVLQKIFDFIADNL